MFVDFFVLSYQTVRSYNRKDNIFPLYSSLQVVEIHRKFWEGKKYVKNQYSENIILRVTREQKSMQTESDKSH